MATKADSERTQVGALPRANEDDGITLTLALPPRFDDGATLAGIGAAPDAAPDGASPAARINPIRYVILGEAGRGGMATVHLARDVELMRRVALKQLSSELANAESARLRFLREVQITAQLDHPYIVPVYGLEVSAEGTPAYAMKFVQGTTLADLLRDCRDAYADGGTPDETHGKGARLEHFLKVCDAVGYAHDKGVIHRDLKPANVMIGPHREIYVMDWGICRLFERDDADAPDAPQSALGDSTGGNHTEFGAVVGTPRYMSPEQAQGRSELLGPHSDQCALGLILLELCTLRAPIEGDTPLQALDNAAHGRRAPLTHAFERRPLPAPLRAIIERATRYDANQRYPSVAAFADDLRRFLRGEAVHALPDSLWQRAQRYVGRHRQGVLLSLFGLVAAGALVTAGLLWRHEQALLAAQARDALLRDRVDAVAQLGDRLQLGLLSLQAELDALATGAVQLLLHGEPAPEAKLYWPEDFERADARPPDLAARDGFPQPVSLNWAVWSVAPGVSRETVLPQAQRLQHLRGFRNELFATARASLGGGDYANGVAELRMVLASGLTMQYPGHALASVQDARESEAYRQLAAEQHARWGDPYLGSDGHTVLLPLGTRLHDRDAGTLGTVSMELELDRALANLAPSAPGERLLLLDDEGHILAASDARNAMPTEAAGRAALPLFGDAALRAAMQDEDVGVIETRALGDAAIVAFDRIHPLEWLLVHVAPDPDED